MATSTSAAATRRPVMPLYLLFTAVTCLESDPASNTTHALFQGSELCVRLTDGASSCRGRRQRPHLGRHADFQVRTLPTLISLVEGSGALG